MLPSVLATQAMGLINGAAPALVVAASHLARNQRATNVLQRRGLTSSSIPAAGETATAGGMRPAMSTKIRPGLRSFAAQPALAETDMFCYQVDTSTDEWQQRHALLLYDVRYLLEVSTWF